MKKPLLLLTFSLLTVFFCNAQDIITKKSGEDIQSKILEIGQDEGQNENVVNGENGPILIYEDQVADLSFGENS
mgnify:CR=1 FL=1